MDISCGIEFQFPESNNLNDFVGTSSGISDKLDLGTGQLLDSVSVTTPCTDHDATDKHLSAADFKLDLGPANDFVSSSDFPLETTVSDITSDTLIVNEECSEGYSIVNAALEGGSTIPKHTIPASCALNLGNVTNIQTLQVNSSALSGMQAVQIIPIENMELLSLVKPIPGIHGVQTQANTPGVVLTNSPSAVLLGNVLLLQTLPTPVTQNALLGGSAGVSPGIGSDQNQILQVLNVQNKLPDQPSMARLPSSYQCMNTNLLNHQPKLILPGLVATTSSATSIPGSTAVSASNRPDTPTALHNVGSSVDKSNQKGTDLTSCENVMSLAQAPAVHQNVGAADASNNKELMKTGAKSDIDSQKNTKILVYGKNIALTFDCRNQNYVMKSIVKAMGQIKGNTGNESSKTDTLSSKTDTLSSKMDSLSSSARVEGDKSSSNELRGLSKMSAMKYVSILGPSPAKKTKNGVQKQADSLDLDNTAIPSKDCVKDTTNCQQRDSLPVNDDVEERINKEGAHCETASIKTVDPDLANTSSVIDKVKTVEPKPLDTSCETEKIQTISGDKVSCTSVDKTAVITVLGGSNQQKQVAAKVPLQEDSTSEEKEYKCDLCSAAFNRFGNYTRHRMIHTVNTKDNYRYKCSECGRLFLQRCDMKRHMLIHTKQEPYKCQECGKGYIRRSDLVVHMRFHRKERAFKCSYCVKEFYQSGDLNRHVRNVHLLSSLLNCGHCNRQFVKEATLIRHMQTKHKDIIIKSLKDKFVKPESVKETPQDSNKVEIKCGSVGTGTADDGDSGKATLQPERDKTNGTK